MLLVSDAKGFVEQVVLVGDFAALKEIHLAAGKSVVETEHRDDFSRLYISDGEAIERPMVDVDGEIGAIAADGDDALQLKVTPPAFTLTVLFDGIEVFAHAYDTGRLEFAADHPGHYQLRFDAAFPYWPRVIDVEAK